MTIPGKTCEFRCFICREVIADLVDITKWNDFHVTYWAAAKMPICPSHSVEERRAFQIEEAVDCQVIDADCNDCRHFKRGVRMLYRGDRVKAEGEGGEFNRIVVAKDVFHGQCQKFGKSTVAHVNKATGHACFEHRRATV